MSSFSQGCPAWLRTGSLQLLHTLEFPAGHRGRDNGTLSSRSGNLLRSHRWAVRIGALEFNLHQAPVLYKNIPSWDTPKRWSWVRLCAVGSLQSGNTCLALHCCVWAMDVLSWLPPDWCSLKCGYYCPWGLHVAIIPGTAHWCSSVGHGDGTLIFAVAAQQEMPAGNKTSCHTKVVTLETWERWQVDASPIQKLWRDFTQIWCFLA